MTDGASVVLGAVLLTAGAQKLLNRAAFRAALVRYHRFPMTVRRTTFHILPPAEAVLGVFLVVGYAPLIAAGLALALLIALTGAFAYQRPLSGCGCLGGPELGFRAHLLQNGAVAGLAVVALWDAKFAADNHAGVWIKASALVVAISVALWGASRQARTHWTLNARINLLRRYHLRRPQWSPEEVRLLTQPHTETQKS